MEKGSPQVTVKVTFTDKDGATTTAPSGVSFTSATTGVDTFVFNSVQNSDGTYDLTVGPVAVGTDTISTEGLTGSLPVAVLPTPAVGVSFSPTSV